MARPLRIEFPGAWYHVTSRDSGRQQIGKDGQDLPLLGRSVVGATLLWGASGFRWHSVLRDASAVSCGHVRSVMDEQMLLKRITVNPKIFGGKPIVRGRRLAVEHVLGMLAAGDTPDTILRGYPWLEPEDIQACLAYAHRLVGHERIDPLPLESAS